ncbi:MAG: hypothetical protein M3680_28260, partial [Myxococcota bacterium]|nr:hypothetical protein [Myxococcota bacterium]
MTSLGELRAIEAQRIADECAAIRSAELARVEAVADAERRRHDAAAAQLRAEHEVRLAIERARGDA